MVGMGKAQPVAPERQQAIHRRRIRTQRRRTEEERLLAGPLVLVEQHHHQAGPAAEPTKNRALADAGGGGDVVHADRIGAALGDEPARGVQQQRTVAGRVAALQRRGRGAARPARPTVQRRSHLHFNPDGIIRTMVRLSRAKM